MWKVFGGLFFLLFAIGAFGIWSVPGILMGIIALVAGVSLIANS